MLEIDYSLCINCGECALECHTGAIIEKKGRYSIIQDNCILCEACADICEQGAIYDKN